MTLKALLEEIYKKGLSQEEIATFIGAHHSHVSRMLKDGRDTKYSVGKRIEELYVLVCIQNKVVEVAA